MKTKTFQRLVKTSTLTLLLAIFHMTAIGQNQIHEVIIESDGKFQALTELPNQQGFAMVSGDNATNGAGNFVTKVDMNGTVNWTKNLHTQNTSLSFDEHLDITNHRITCDANHTDIVVGGTHMDPNDGPASVVHLSIANGTLQTTGTNRIFHTAVDGRSTALMDFKSSSVFVAGTADDLPFIALEQIGVQARPGSTGETGAYRSVDVDHDKELVAAVGFESDGTTVNAIVDIYKGLSGPPGTESSISLKHPSHNTEADAVVALGNSRFMVGGHFGSSSFIAMLAPFGIVWQKELTGITITEMVQHQEGDVAFIFSAGSGDNSSGVAKIDVNGELHWVRKYGKDEIVDLVATEDGGFAILAFDSPDKNILIRTDQNGRSGCETDTWLNIDDGDLRIVSAILDDAVSASQFQDDVISDDVFTLTSDQGECCWFPYDPFPGRTTWFCDPAELNADPDGLNFDSIVWTNDVGSAPADDTQVGEFVAFTDPVQYQNITVTVIDGDGCRGEDAVRIAVTEDGTWPSFGIEDQFCKDTPGPVFLPAWDDHHPDYTMDAHYEQNGTVLVRDDLTTVDNLSTPGTNSVTMIIDEQLFNSGCPIEYNYVYEVIDCPCSPSNPQFNLGSWEDDWGKDLFGITPSNVSLDVVKFRFSLVENGCNSASAGPAFLLFAGEMDNPSSGNIPYFYYPVMSEKKLHGWSGTVPLGMNNDLMLELWYTTDTQYPWSVCGYEKSCLNTETFAKHSLRELTQEALPFADFNLFPNPSTGQFNFQAMPEGASLTIFNLQGQPVYQISNTVGGSTITADLSDQAAGVYVFYAKHADEVVFGRLIKE